MKRRLLSLLLGSCILLTTLSGCSSKDTQEAQSKREIDLSDRNAALMHMAKIGVQFRPWQKAPESIYDLEGLSPERLTASLPQPINSWEVTELDSNIEPLENFCFSQAKRSYRQGEQQIHITVIDVCHAKYLIDIPSPIFTGQFPETPDDGYYQGVSMGDAIGFEEYAYNDRAGNLQLVYQKRFYVEIEGDGIEQEALWDWWQKLEQSLSTNTASIL